MPDKRALALFLRNRRHMLQPEEVGLPRTTTRRRIPGLRREEVAELCHMSTDYYTRLEQNRGPRPSRQMLLSIANGLRLTNAEQDHLFHLTGHNPPQHQQDVEEVSLGLLRIFERLGDTPAEIVSELGETLYQTGPSIELSGDLRNITGPERSIFFRWFSDTSYRSRYPEADHEKMSQLFVSKLRTVATQHGEHSRAAPINYSLSVPSSGRSGTRSRSASALRVSSGCCTQHWDQSSFTVRASRIPTPITSYWYIQRSPEVQRKLN